MDSNKYIKLPDNKFAIGPFPTITFIVKENGESIWYAKPNQSKDITLEDALKDALKENENARHIALWRWNCNY